MSRILFRLALWQVLFVLLAGTAVYFLMEGDRERTLREAFLMQGRNAATAAAKAVEPAAAKANRQSVQAALDAFRGSSGAAWVWVVAADGKVVAHTFGASLPAALANVRIPPGSDWLDVDFPGEGRPATIFVQPVLKGAAGVVYVGLDRQPLIGSVRQMRTGLMSTIGAVAAAWLAAFLVSGWIVLGPLRTLSKTVSRLKEDNAGWFRWQPLKPRDPIGALTADFRSLAAELRDRTDKLEERVAERTQELMRRNAELAIEIVERKRAERESLLARDAAETANRAKSAFLANISHELRTPMNGIIGTTELIQSAGINAQQSEYFDIIRGSAQSLLAVINDILDFSKIEAGKFELDLVDFDLPSLVHETVKPLALKAEKSGLQLLCRIDPEVPELVHGDPIRVRQVLTNIAGNALKFTSKGEIEISAGVESRGDGFNVLHFRVRDTGIGISRDQQEAIFEPFRQADITMSRKFGGTGLGLSISSRLVHMMGGRIWLESEVGKGSTFHFTVRFDAATASTAQPIEGLEKHFTGLRVLVVDDNPTSRKILHEYLTRARMQVAVRPDAGSAFEALVRADSGQHPFDLLVAECHMRLEDGFALAHRIRSTTALAGLPILVLSSGVLAEDLNRCLRVGVGVCLPKPVDERDLHAAVLRVLSQRAPEKTAPQAAQPVQPAVPETGALQVLLAEDNRVNQLIGVKLLEKLGHFVHVAGNGQVAFEEVKKQHFDLVLMDLQMPEMDGYAATRAIREWEKGTGRRIPIIAMTAHAMNRDIENCFAAGMDAHVAKPVNLTELEDKIRTVLEERPGPNAERVAAKSV